MFLDDTFLTYKARVTYSFLDQHGVDELVLFLKQSSLNLSLSELNSYVAKPKHYKFALIAKIKNAIIGVAFFTDLESEVLLNHLYVAPIHRFKGIGSALIKLMRQFMPHHDLSYIDTSSNMMPWMNHLDRGLKLKLTHYLGTFYKPNLIKHSSRDSFLIEALEIKPDQSELNHRPLNSCSTVPSQR